MIAFLTNICCGEWNCLYGKSYNFSYFRRKRKDEFEDDGFIDDSFSSKPRVRKVEDRKLSDKEKKEEEARKRRIENSKKAPPPVDFNSLLRLADVKKDLPVKLEKKVVAKEHEFGDRPDLKRLAFRRGDASTALLFLVVGYRKQCL